MNFSKAEKRKSVVNKLETLCDPVGIKDEW